MKRKYITLTAFLLFFIPSIFLFINMKFLKDNNEETYIDVYLNNELNNIKLGSSFKDLLIMNNLDLDDSYNISLDYILKNNEYLHLDNESNDSVNKISINTSSIDELITLPGIGEKTANKIIEYREKYGSFKHIEEIKNVSGIGDKKYEKIKELISI